MNNTQPDFKYELHSRASAYQCRTCPPGRVCAQNCIQGASVADIIVGASLALGSSTHAAEMEQAGTRQALWNLYNRVAAG